MPTVIVPAPYQGPTQGRGEIPVNAGTVIDCLKAVDSAHPGFLDLVVDDSGAVHRFVKLFVNEEQIDSKALDQALAAEDRLEVLAAIAGG